MISIDGLQRLFPKTATAQLAHFVQPLAEAAGRYDLSTSVRASDFLGVIGHETGGLNRLAESLNYSVDGLLTRFGRHRISAADAQRLGRKAGEPALNAMRQAAIANVIYGGDWGLKNLGNTKPGDGWLCRGMGGIQITGRGNMAAMGKAFGLTVEQISAMLQTPRGAILGSAWWWQTNGLNAIADKGDFKRICCIANRGPGVDPAMVPDDDPLLALADRTAIRDAALKILGGH